jgi:hypothetical protein
MRVLLTAVTLAALFFLIGMKLPQGSCTNCNGNTLEVVSLNATGNGYFGGTLYTPTKVCPCTGAWPDRYQPWNCPKLKRVHWGGTAIKQLRYCQPLGRGRFLPIELYG